MTDMPPIPHDRAAEEAVLGSLLISPESYYQVAAILKPVDFFIHRNGWVFEAIGRLALEHTDIDLVTVSSEMDRRGEDYGGSAYLTGLMLNIPTSMNVLSYAKIVAEQSTRRGLIKHANAVAALAYSSDTIGDVLANVQSSAALATERTGSKRMTAKEIGSKTIDVVLNHPRRFKFGIPNVDQKLKGIFPDRFYIWAGYQGSGKSALMLQNCRENAEAGHKVMIVSLEMSPEQCWMRMACGDLGIDLDTVMAGEIDSDTKTEIIEKIAELSDKYQGHLVIYSAPMTPMDILAAAKTERPDIIWIDHSRLLSGKPKEMNGYEWAVYIPTFLRQNIAKSGAVVEGGISVHMLMQLSRGAHKENRRPDMHDLRLAGEDDPDMVTLLYRPEVDPADKLPIGQVKLELNHDKNRFGWTGVNHVIFDLPFQKFYPTEMINTNDPASMRRYEKQAQYAMNSAVGSED